MNVTTVAEVGRQPPETLIYLHRPLWSQNHVMLTFSPFSPSCLMNTLAIQVTYFRVETIANSKLLIAVIFSPM